MKIYLSLKPAKKGGGSNTFVCNFVKWCKNNGHKIVYDIKVADKAIIIAHYAELENLKKAKQKGVHLIHRVDEYFEKNEDDFRREKHAKIIEISQYADITVFQSEFVCNNAFPFMKPKNYTIILNGADQKIFHPVRLKDPGKYIGHITWSVGETKRLDVLYKKIKKSPNETFLLVGRHQESNFDFKLNNVILAGEKTRKRLPRLIRKMKMLFYPAEKDPCSNTVIEAIISGVPVCYNTPGGVSEIVRDCGAPLSDYQKVFNNLDSYRNNCFKRTDLHFNQVAEKYLAL